MEIHFLDMGHTRYGDCVFITNENRSILIDGGHIGDSESIMYQLSKILKVDAPINIDLLVVTHCHGDHIGCLPKLIKNEEIIVHTALLADEKYGWGLGAEINSNFDKIKSDFTKIISYGLLEEDHSSLPDDELEKFLSDAVKLPIQYQEMIQKLEEKATRIFRYNEKDWKSLKIIENDFIDFGLKILGPSLNHLAMCGIAIAESVEKDQIIIDNISADNNLKLVDKYRSAFAKLSEDSVASDRPGPGAAKNNQSIVLKITSKDGWSALLAGDMQLAKAEVPRLDKDMEKLRAVINQEGPYDIIKLTHHTSYNGLNENILNSWIKKNVYLIHSGGKNDLTHPDEGVLQILKKYKSDFKFARTDRNGLISFKYEDGELKIHISKGRLNNFTPNEPTDAEVLPLEELSPKHEVPALEQNPGETPIEIKNKNQINNGIEIIEVLTRIPNIDSKITITIQVDTEKKKLNKELIDNRVSKNFNNLTFVTNSKKLSHKIGQQNFYQIREVINNNNGTIIDLSNTNIATKTYIQSLLNPKTCKGVIIIGDYDVVPITQFDSIGEEIRNGLRRQRNDDYDSDGFYVWSDDIYTDFDNDRLPDIPISRIPDSSSSELIIKSLTSIWKRPETKYAMRNLARDFADGIFPGMPGKGNIIDISANINPSNISLDESHNAVYLMLHGSFSDGSRFWGETESGQVYEAISINTIKKKFKGSVVFSGCCYGALLSNTPPNQSADSQILKRIDNSMALSILDSGASAFIGCTGTHYSPRTPPYNYAGKPMHDYFWEFVNNGFSASQALNEAKKKYSRNLPHAKNELLSKAIELKTLHQFTCLGIGW